MQCGKSQIFKAGTSDALDCKSWHDFRHYLGEVVQASYLSEVPIRAMNMNRLTDEKGRRNKFDIVDRIIKFDDNRDYQTDLLGEDKESSELSALIDGILGANSLFIQRSNGWDIKKVDETEGNIGAVLTLINNTLLRKREQPYLVKKLRDELIAPPYGIPACNLAIFAAVAVRHDVKRLRWVGSKETDFAKDLTEAFESDSKLSIRLSDFSTKQATMLAAVGHYFLIEKQSDQSVVEYASECSYRLRDFVKDQSEVVRQSRQLQDKTQKLVKFFDQVGKLPQDTADFLIDLCDFKTIESVTAIAATSLKIIFDDFSKVEDAKRHDLEQSWKEFLALVVTTKADLILRLTHERATSLAKAVGELLNAEQAADANALTMALLNKPFTQCNDSDIGICRGQLGVLVDYHPPRPPQSPLLPPLQTDPSCRDDDEESTTENPLIDILRRQIHYAQLPREQVRVALQSLLNDYA